MCCASIDCILQFIQYIPNDGAQPLTFFAFCLRMFYPVLLGLHWWLLTVSQGVKVASGALGSA